MPAALSMICPRLLAMAVAPMPIPSSGIDNDAATAPTAPPTASAATSRPSAATLKASDVENRERCS